MGIAQNFMKITENISYHVAAGKISKELLHKIMTAIMDGTYEKINRGEISKIFGELFFAVDPGYRGVAGEVPTQYANLRADERLEMLANLNNEEKEAEAIARMSALNVEIAATEGLDENYQIGASYFLKLKNIDFDRLWSDYLHPLLQEYIMVWN